MDNSRSLWIYLPFEIKNYIKSFTIHYSIKIINEGINWISKILNDEKKLIDKEKNNLDSYYINSLKDEIWIPYSLDFEWFTSNYVRHIGIGPAYDSDNDNNMPPLVSIRNNSRNEGIIIEDEVKYYFRKKIFKKFNLLRIIYRNQINIL